MSHRLTQRQRLSGQHTFQAVYAGKVRHTVGPLAVCAIPNELGYSRLGLSVPRRVGTAVRRNRIKRLLRESFRHTHFDWPSAYDVVLVVKPHEPVTLADYQRLLSSAMRKIHQRWQAKAPS